MTDLSLAEHDAVMLQLGRILVAANKALRSPDADVHAVLEKMREQIPPGRLWHTLLVAAASLPKDRPETDLLAWAADERPIDERPSWRWVGAHQRFLNALMARTDPEQMPDSVRQGEERYQAALRREQGERLPAAS